MSVHDEITKPLANLGLFSVAVHLAWGMGDGLRLIPYWDLVLIPFLILWLKRLCANRGYYQTSYLLPLGMLCYFVARSIDTMAKGYIAGIFLFVLLCVSTAITFLFKPMPAPGSPADTDGNA